MRVIIEMLRGMKSKRTEIFAGDETRPLLNVCIVVPAL